MDVYPCIVVTCPSKMEKICVIFAAVEKVNFGSELVVLMLDCGVSLSGLSG